MLEKPDFPDEKIVACLQTEYSLDIAQLAFLPLGADTNTAVYRAVAKDETTYFVKLRRGDFNESVVTVPKFLSDQGISQIIPPLATGAGQLWGSLAEFKVILYPFVEGHNAYEVHLSDQHWRDFGRTLRAIHTLTPPPALLNGLPRETFSPQWREMVKMFLAQVETEIFADPVAAEVAALLRIKGDEIRALVERTEQLASLLQTQPRPFILCHADIHAGNTLIDTKGALYIVDWDTLLLAPKERDLMYAGGGQFAGRRSPQEEERLFYQGYGPTEADPAGLAYYRYERIVQDIALYCEALLLSDEGGEDREQSLYYLKSNFLPNGVLEIAYSSEGKR